EPHAIASPARTIWRRSYSSRLVVPTVTVDEWRPAASGPAGRLDGMLVTFTLLTPSIPASLLLAGSLGDIFLTGSVVTLTLTVLPPATVAGVQSATIAVPPVPAFAGLLLHLQGADLDIATSVLQMSQPASLLLVP